MNRFDFSNFIEIPTIEQVTEYFGEVMILFNLIGEFDINNIDFISDQNSIILGITFLDGEEATKASNNLICDCIDIYGAKCSISNMEGKTSNEKIVTITKL